MDAWSAEATPYLRKYYIAGSDEPHFDLHPDTEEAIQFMASLEDRKLFIGTESRLLTVFRLLTDIVDHTDLDPKERLQKLRSEREDLDRKIAEVEGGVLRTFDVREITERLLQAEATARELLSDFRKVEENFRELDRTTRERIATGDQSKGALLDQIFGDHDVIWNSDQGRSFSAFWEFLMAQDRQEELRLLIGAVEGIEEISALRELEFLRLIQRHLIEAGEPVYKTNNLLSEQLRKYLSSQAYLENKRIAEFIKRIEKQAVEAVTKARSTNLESADFESSVQTLKVSLSLITERTPYTIPADPLTMAKTLAQGDADFNANSLFEQNYIDLKALQLNVARALSDKTQVSLNEVVRHFPIEKGVAEIVGYLSIAVRDSRAHIDETISEEILFMAADGNARLLEIRKVIFTTASSL